MRAWNKTLKPLLNLFFESTCPLCDRATANVFCQDCDRQVRGCRLLNPRELWHMPLPLFAWGVYGGALKRSIATLKYGNHPEIARPLGHWLAEAWLASPIATSPLTVVPIPMHADKQKERGFNQAELLADAFCELTHLSLQRHGLQRNRTTEAQFGLSATAREQNLSGAFQLGSGFLRHRPPSAVLLLDDIYTTGATARTAARVLREHQIDVYGVLAIAKPVEGEGAKKARRVSKGLSAEE